MPPEMEEVAADICMKAVMRYTVEEDIAEHVKLVRSQKWTDIALIWEEQGGKNLHEVISCTLTRTFLDFKERCKTLNIRY